MIQLKGTNSRGVEKRRTFRSWWFLQTPVILAYNRSMGCGIHLILKDLVFGACTPLQAAAKATEQP